MVAANIKNLDYKALDTNSPFYRRIIVSALDEHLLFPAGLSKVDWRVSTATVVDGILKLFSKRPKHDRNQMFKSEGTIKTRIDLEDDGTPLRKMFRETNDLGIYTIIYNYFTTVENVFWKNAKGNSYIKKTVGIQALFDVLHFILSEYRENKIGSSKVEIYEKILSDAKSFDFSTAHYQQASGIGRKQMRESIIEAIKPDLKKVIEKLKEDENKGTETNS